MIVGKATQDVWKSVYWILNKENVTHLKVIENAWAFQGSNAHSVYQEKENICEETIKSVDPKNRTDKFLNYSYENEAKLF